jgi:McrBC 5-methylcytosine restriction system component
MSLSSAMVVPPSLGSVRPAVDAGFEARRLAARADEDDLFLPIGPEVHRPPAASFTSERVEFDDFTEDIELNRMLKAAIRRLGRLRIRSAAARQALRSFGHALERVRDVEYDPRQLPAVTYTRLNDRYRSAVELAKLVLRTTSLELEHGGQRGAAFLLDMNRVFEDFVVVALREHLRLSHRELVQAARHRRLWLDRKSQIRLKPDLSWWDAGRCVFVGDVKVQTRSGRRDRAPRHLPAACLLDRDETTGRLADLRGRRGDASRARDPARRKAAAHRDTRHQRGTRGDLATSVGAGQRDQIDAKRGAPRAPQPRRIDRSSAQRRCREWLLSNFDPPVRRMQL